MSTELIPADQQTALASIVQVAKDYGIMAIEGKNEMEKTLILATGMGKLKTMLTPAIMQPIMALQNSSLGFRTDKEGGYPIDVVRDVTAEAFLRGFRMTGNEINIIAGRFYAAKDGCRRLVIEWPGLTNFDCEMSFPRDEGGKAYVDFIATWKLNGIEQQYERRGKTALSIRRNSGMIDDAIMGKAERKMYAAVLSKLSNFIMPEGDIEGTNEMTAAPSKVKRSSLNDYADEPKQPSKPEYDATEQACLTDEWKQAMDQCRLPLEVQQKQKEAAQSGKLSPESMNTINTYANKRKRELQ